MKVERRDGSTEKRIVTAMVVDQQVLGHIAPKWVKEGLFKSPWSNQIANWCVNYYKKYGKAPAKSIEGIFESWASNKALDKDTVTLVEKFLEGLSGEYVSTRKSINSQYIVDLAGMHFNRVQLDKLAETIQGDLERGKADEALQRVKGFAEIEIGRSEVIDVLQDKAAIQEAFSESTESLIQYPGALESFFGDSLGRDQFLSFMAPDKVGKSFWLIDIAWRAMLQRRKVAMFQVGDMSRNQVLRRLMARASRRPMRATKKDKIVKYPTYIVHDPDAKYAEVDHKELKFKEDLDWRVAWKACEDIITNKIKTKEPLLRMSVHPTDTISIQGVKGILQGWERQGWTPDVIVIDYADILAPENGKDDSLTQINKTWKAMRSLSLSLHCLVATATQSNAEAYKTDLLTRRNFSGNKLKMAHVTGMIGINVSPEEKDNQLFRLNWIVLREEKFHSSKCVHVAGCLPLANPAIKSTF